jgi:undecaprenyl diphosphate synthase
MAGLFEKGKAVMQKNRSELIEQGRRVVAETKMRHVALIVDGNRRWARARRKTWIEGHRKALEVVLGRVEDGIEMGLEVMTFWLFSTENWRRDANHVNALFRLGKEYDQRLHEELRRLNVRFRHIGRKDRIPDFLSRLLTNLESETQTNDAATVVAALDYGGRDDVLRAVNKAIAEKVPAVTEEYLSSQLDAADLPNPDLVIRTSGEIRTSGFMIWQTVYSEWSFPKVFFPDLDTECFVSEVCEFGTRNRRFGGGR